MLYSIPMISLDDSRWSNMTAGYRVPFDPRPLLKRLETDGDATEVWGELWGELHHQGDVGEASFAAVPFLVNIYRERGVIDWNTYAIVATIELARKEGTNPDVPQWMANEYFRAIEELAKLGAKEVFQAEGAENVRFHAQRSCSQEGSSNARKVLSGLFRRRIDRDRIWEVDSG